MPYRINPDDPRVVQVQRDGEWVTTEGGRHESPGEAQSHLTALNINVGEEHKAMRKKERAVTKLKTKAAQPGLPKNAVLASKMVVAAIKTIKANRDTRSERQIYNAIRLLSRADRHRDAVLVEDLMRDYETAMKKAEAVLDQLNQRVRYNREIYE